MGHEPTKQPVVEQTQELAAWLMAGNLVVAASERAARALAAAYNRARRAEGLTAWPAANILDWHTFVRNAWNERGGDSRMVLSGFQEQALWAEMIVTDGHRGALLEGPRNQIAKLAREAHRLLCNYAPAYFSSAARIAWQQDAAAFSNWLTAFDRIANSSDLVSEARLPWELANSLAMDTSSRPALLLTGFDRILPTQRRVFDAWGSWREAAAPLRAKQLHFYAAPDQTTELAACAQWCKLQLDANPHTRLLVVTQDVASRRGEMERAFFGIFGGQANIFEFSLGVPLRQTALARSAHLILRWLSGAGSGHEIGEHEIDWLFSTGHLAADPGESRALTGFMRELRHCGMERTRWQLKDFIAQRPGAAILPTAWLERMTRATRQLQDATRSAAEPLVWAELVPRLLSAAGWPGGRTLTSGEFQALRRWQQALDACATLGFNGQRMSWSDFLFSLSRALDEALFAPESQDAPVQIAGPAESAGLTADAIWMMGASEDHWPAGGSTNPLLPISVQREAFMPHALPQLDWDLAQSITTRIAASASEVHFSYARQIDGVAARPSRLIERISGPPQSMPGALCVPTAPTPRTEIFEDRSRVPLSATNASGGSNVLTSQSQCPFKAFATGRLNAIGWEPAQAGLTASQRGLLLHAVLHSVWAGGLDGIRTHAELVAVTELDAFVERHVRLALRQNFYLAASQFMPRRYLELERVRLSRLVTEWLEFERTRAAFSVARTEFDTDATVAGLDLRLRIDRIDMLNDGSLLIIDYKSGDVSPSLWALPRPEDVQLPLYACFGLNQELRETITQESGDAPQTEATGCIGGLVFAKIRPGEVCFAGRVGNAQETLHPGTSKFSALARYPLDAAELLAWREKIEELALDFIAGSAHVDPRDYPKTCERCDLHSVCRIAESRAPIESEEDSDD